MRAWHPRACARARARSAAGNPWSGGRSATKLLGVVRCLVKLKALELRLPGVGEGLLRAPAEALAAAGRDDVPLLYWTGAAWGGALSYGLDQPGLVADLPETLPVNPPAVSP